MPERKGNGTLLSLVGAVVVATLVSIVGGVITSPGELRREQEEAATQHRQDIAALRNDLSKLTERVKGYETAIDLLKEHHGVFTDDEARAYAEQVRAAMAQLERELRARINELHRVP